MNDLQHEFIRQSVADLQSLAEKSRRYENEKLPDNLLREIFRVLHTVKGTSQVFSLSASAGLAHALENLLAGAKKDEISAEDLKLLAPAGVEILASMLAEKTFQIPASFAEKIQKFQSESSAENTVNDLYLPELPAEFSNLLSSQEKSLINEMLASGSDLFVLEIGFETINFAAEFKNFRSELAEKGEIVAALPSVNFAEQKKIGFQIVYAATEHARTFVENSAAKITHQIYAVNSNNLSGVLAQIVGHGKTLAKRLGKTIEFKIFSNAETPPAPVLKVVFDALAHLVRNAVSHAFDESGKIIIETKTVRNFLVLKVSDDGKGLNAEKIRSKAIEKHLISDNQILSESETVNLIFMADFSTADEVSDVSGRGVGLDAVKTAVENAGGKISVESKMGAGATFEISLPVDFNIQSRDDAETEDDSDKN
jgi:two-component system chemotaxis sensor kinase CheA